MSIDHVTRQLFFRYFILHGYSVYHCWFCNCSYHLDILDELEPRSFCTTSRRSIHYTTTLRLLGKTKIGFLAFKGVRAKVRQNYLQIQTAIKSRVLGKVTFFMEIYQLKLCLTFAHAPCTGRDKTGSEN